MIEPDIHKIYVIICPICNENIVEREDESWVQNLLQAEGYWAAHLIQHIKDGSVTEKDGYSPETIAHYRSL
jgi:hypothetical protein